MFATIMLTAVTPQRQGILGVVVPALTRLLNDRDENVQFAARVALHRMDPKKEITESDLDDILEDVLGNTGYDPFDDELTLSDFDMEDESWETAWGTAWEIETALQPSASP